MPMKTPVTAISAVAALSLGLLAAGCGGDASSSVPASAPERAAAPAAECDPSQERDSRARSLTFINLLPVPVSLGVSGVNCAQWSGVSTPYAWNGVTLDAGNGGRGMRMEMGRRTRPAWTFTVNAPGALTPFAVRCPRPADTCGYNVQGAPDEPWSTQVVISTDLASPDWAVTAAQRKRIDNIATDHLILWSDGSKVYVSSYGEPDPDSQRMRDQEQLKAPPPSS